MRFVYGSRERIGVEVRADGGRGNGACGWMGRDLPLSHHSSQALKLLSAWCSFFSYVSIKFLSRNLMAHFLICSHYPTWIQLFSFPSLKSSSRKVRGRCVPPSVLVLSISGLFRYNAILSFYSPLPIYCLLSKWSCGIQRHLIVILFFWSSTWNERSNCSSFLSVLLPCVPD